MKDVDYTFENTMVTCDKCGFEEEVDYVDYDSINRELREMGWTIKKENGEWVEYCSTCS